MNLACSIDQDYIDFLIGSPAVMSATKAARVQPARPQAPAHDFFTRLLHRFEPDSETRSGPKSGPSSVAPTASW